MNTKPVGAPCTYVNYYTDWLEGVCQVELRERELAGTFHKATSQVANIGTFDPVESALRIETTMVELSNALITRLNHTLGEKMTTLKELSPRLNRTITQYKSDYRTGIGKGLNPQDYATYSRFATALNELRKDSGSTPPSSTSTSNNGTENKGNNASNVVSIHNLPSKSEDKLKKTLKMLEAFSESEAQALIDSFHDKVFAALRKGNKKVAATG